MGWLSGWDKRVKLTIDQTDIDAALSNFPILVYLSTASGRNDDDVSFVFDELQSDANRLKIAVTESDGTTQCYVEIEQWDDANEKAWLWVKVSSIAADVDTDLYLYYDKDHADNTDYVGDIESIPGKAVWDDNFLRVYHLRDKTTSTVADSKNNQTGNKTSANNPLESSEGIAASQTADNADWIKAPTISYDPTLDYTIEMRIKTSTTASSKAAFSEGDNSNNYYELGFMFNMNGFVANKMGFGMEYNWGTWYHADSTTSVNDNAWHHIVGTYKGSTSPYPMKIYVDGTAEGTTEYGQRSTATTGNQQLGFLTYTRNNGSIHILDTGLLDEVRISNVIRSNSWIKATHETERDDLLDWGSEETQVAPPEGQPYISRVQQISGMQTFNPIHAIKPLIRRMPWPQVFP